LEPVRIYEGWTRKLGGDLGVVLLFSGAGVATALGAITTRLLTLLGPIIRRVRIEATRTVFGRESRVIRRDPTCPASPTA
jgi:uncharacterized membrane protein YdcZ (DUF606 family)